MINGQSRILDELAKLTIDLARSACGMRNEIGTLLQLQIEKFLNSLDLVKREEFEVLKELTLKVQEENITLMEKVAMLEMQVTPSPEKNNSHLLR